MEIRGRPLRLALVHSSIALCPAPLHLKTHPLSLPFVRTSTTRDWQETQTITIRLRGNKLAHDNQSQINFSLRRLFNRSLPRSKPPPVLPDRANDMWQHTWKFIVRLLLESSCAASILSLASSVLFDNVSRKFVVTGVVRWLVLSLAIRMCILQAIIASMSSFATEDCYFAGSYCVLAGDGSTIPVIIRKNVGHGSCLFQSIAASILTNETESIAHPSHAAVMEYSSILRDLAVTTLANGIETNAQMVLLQNETISASLLVNEVAEQYGMTAHDYLSDMRLESVWGGGPEIVAVSNSLNRQIVLLERVDPGYLHDNTTLLGVRARLGPLTTNRPIYILSTDQRFPKYHGKAINNHFLAIIPSRPF